MGCNSLTCDHHRVGFDFDRIFADNGTDAAFDEILQQTRERTSSSDGDHEASDDLVAKAVEEKAFQYLVTMGKRATTNSGDVPLGFSSVPKKKRGDRGGKKSSRFYDVGFTTGSSSSDHGSSEDNKGKRTSTRKRRQSDEDEDTVKIKPTKKNKNKPPGDQKVVDFKRLGLDQLDFSNEIKHMISWQDGVDKDFQLRITKKLFNADLDPQQDRLSMPLNQIKDVASLVRDGEDEKAKERKGPTNPGGLEVTLFDLVKVGNPSHDHDDANNIIVESMRLRKWALKSSFSYVLTTSWKSVKARNEQILKEDDIVQIYSFRRNGKLCFVLIKVSDINGCRDGAFESNRNNNNNNTDHDQEDASAGMQGNNEDAYGAGTSSAHT